MNHMESARNFNTISPSAKTLLLMKGHTDIPFARQMAELMEYPEKYNPNFDKKDFTFWARVLHFEKRYRSIDQLLEGLPVCNFLELSSGFSLRGLEITKNKGFYYIDTDLPDVIATKKNIIIALKNESFPAEGKLELLPLNALDDEQFHKIVTPFPAGEIAIVNEGLLMYLDKYEKEKLCHIIHKVLKKRGGYWITGDIYIKKQYEKLNLKIDNKTKEFLEQHHIEDNKFESFEAAEAFFRSMGFVVDKEADINYSRLSAMKYFLQSISPDQLSHFQKVKIQASWRLRIGDH